MKRPPWTVWPGLAWLLAFLMVPVGFVFAYSFAQRGLYGTIQFAWNIDNYRRAWDPLYLEVFWNSLKLAAATATGSLLLGYPLAYWIATSSPRLRGMLLGLVMLPFWTNFVIRVYSIKVLLSERGPFAWLWTLFGGVLEPGFLSQSSFAVALGMMTNYLPFMVLPLYVVLEKFDFNLIEAAHDLGANSFQVFFKILLPLTRRGIFTGWILVFTPALGEFVIPDLLGGAKVMMIGNLITEQFLETRDWPFGSALSMILIGTVMISLVAYLRNEPE